MRTDSSIPVNPSVQVESLWLAQHVQDGHSASGETELTQAKSLPLPPSLSLCRSLTLALQGGQVAQRGSLAPGALPMTRILLTLRVASVITATTASNCNSRCTQSCLSCHHHPGRLSHELDCPTCSDSFPRCFQHVASTYPLCSTTNAIPHSCGRGGSGCAPPIFFTAVFRAEDPLLPAWFMTQVPPSLSPVPPLAPVKAAENCYSRNGKQENEGVNVGSLEQFRESAANLLYSQGKTGGGGGAQENGDCGGH